LCEPSLSGGAVVMGLRVLISHIYRDCCCRVLSPQMHT